MDEDKRVENELKRNGISKYKIIHVITKSLSYLYKYGERKHEESYEDKIEVKFKYKNKVGGFSISSCQPDDVIARIVNDSITKVYNMPVEWDERSISQYYVDNFRKQMFDSCSKVNCIKWLEKEITKIECGINKSTALFYKTELSKCSLRTNENYLEEYLTDAHLTCIVDKRKVEVSDSWLFIDFADTVLRQLKKPQLTYKNLDNNKKLLLKGKAVSQFINKYILMYYASYVYEGNSFIKVEDLGNKLLEKDIDIIVLPYEKVYFDGEGCRMKIKEILKSGRLKNLLSNSLYSMYMGIESYGNSDMNNPYLIKHQRIVFMVNTTCVDADKGAAVLSEFQQLNINLKNNEVIGTAIMEEKDGKYLTVVNFKIDDFLNKLNSRSNSYGWHENVFCPDVFYDCS
ncbi:metallopeptidase TldD-related protein [Clostridium sp.]|jgi:predicted Zn-dependent protease|uniref:metallopeptidase TldD-related protein n=1 Tax=Clostridium sp. TaxID=1506 RepID=UPI0039F4CA1F